MTRNQIEYWNYRETGRHNVATENETNRHNVVTENETERHNRAGENIDISKLAETKRHNLVTEGQNVDISMANLAETMRHNMSQEDLQRSNLSIDAAKLNESVRHNTTSEGIDALIARSQAQLNATIAQLNSVRADWEPYMNQSNANVNLAKIEQMHKELELLDTEIQHNKLSNDWIWAEKISDLVGEAAKSVSYISNSIQKGKKK